MRRGAPRGKVRTMSRRCSVLGVFLKAQRRGATKGSQEEYRAALRFAGVSQAQRVWRHEGKSGRISRRTPFCGCFSKRKGCGATKGSQEERRAVLHSARVSQSAKGAAPPGEVRKNVAPRSVLRVFLNERFLRPWKNRVAKLNSLGAKENE
jgi:hypothetical protein